MTIFQESKGWDSESQIFNRWCLVRTLAFNLLVSPLLELEYYFPDGSGISFFADPSPLFSNGIAYRCYFYIKRVHTSSNNCIFYLTILMKTYIQNILLKCIRFALLDAKHFSKFYAISSTTYWF